MEPTVFQGRYQVVKKTALAKEIYEMVILCPQIAQLAQAGQFVHVKAPSFTLRRPISICEIDRAKGTLRIVFEVRGDGTAEIAQIPQGGWIDLMGPLGHGFQLLEQGKKAIVVGGGIGVPPMLETAAHYGENAVAIIGFRSASAVILEEDFQKAGCTVDLCTDDGTRGRKGFVTEALKARLQQEKPDIIYACGPMVMLKGVAALAKEYGVRCQVSLEERMGCGIGACLVCACKTKKPDGEESYSHVCKNGPVFEAEEVVF